MKNKTLMIAAAVAVALGAGGLAATAHVGGTTDERYNAHLDRVLQELPFLKVEKRSYQRGILGADARLVLRVDLPEPQPKAPGDEDDEDEEEGDETGGRAADGKGADRAAPVATPAVPAAYPRAVLLTVHDEIRHGPFPGSLLPAASRLTTRVEIAVETSDGATAGPLKVLTADTTVDFSDGYQSRFVSPAGDWSLADGRMKLHWTGLTGEASGNVATLQGRYSLSSPGLTMRAVDERQQPFEMVIGSLTAEGSADASTSLLIAPGRVRATLASWQMTGRSPDGRPLVVSLGGLEGETRSQRSGDLLDIRSSFVGNGQFDALKIDRIEMVEQWKRLHAPTLENIIRKLYASMGRQPAANPEALLASMAADVKGFLAHDPEYAVERLNLTIAGRTAEFAWRAALQGVAPDAIEQPMALAGAVTAGFDARLTRQWLEGLLAAGSGFNPAIDADQMGELLTKGQQMGLLEVNGDAIATRVRLDQGTLQVNGRTVFQLPRLR